MSSKWRVYKQNALKIAIRFSNDTGKPREMPEYRRGNNGLPEVDSEGNLKVLRPGESVYIAIEPSSKKFKYHENHWGAAAYPKGLTNAAKSWKEFQKPAEVLEVLDSLKTRNFVVPVYQIADTMKSLGYLEGVTTQEIVKKIRANLKTGHKNLGFPEIITLFKPVSMAIGRILTKADLKHLKGLGIASFGTIYGDVPLQHGMLVNISIDPMSKKLKLNDNKFTIYPIDAPAVKAAMWTALDNVPPKEISDFIRHDVCKDVLIRPYTILEYLLCDYTTCARSRPTSSNRTITK